MYLYVILGSFFNYCNRNDDFIIDLKNSIYLYDSLINNDFDHNTIITNLRDKSYSLSNNTFVEIEKKIGLDLIHKLVNIFHEIDNYIEKKILKKIITIENNQKILINNQKILFESLNQINGNNYAIQVNNYLIKKLSDIKLIKYIIRFYNDIVKKFSSYNLAAAVLSSGEINVNNSMVHTSTAAAQGGLHILESVGGDIPFGKAVTSLATAGGIYYINKKQLEDNLSYYDMIDSVIHTEGIAKLSSLKIIKQINLYKINKGKLNNKYVEFITKKWRDAQINLIREQKLPLYENLVNNIEDFVINITKYHNKLCDIILNEFIMIINDESCTNTCMNKLKCIDSEYLIYNSIIEDDTIDNIIKFIFIRTYFNFWKNL